MIDEIEKKVLYYVYNECGDNFKVMEKTDLDEFMSSNFSKQKISISKVLKSLSNLNYIQIKYCDDNKYCISITDQGKQVFESEKLNDISSKKMKYEMMGLIFIIGFFAFVGSFLGTLLCKLIFK